MSYSSFKQAILLLAASELLLDEQAKAKISAESALASPADLPADSASPATIEAH